MEAQKFKSNLPHYYVKDVLFLLHNEAVEYCIKNSIPLSSIEKTYTYKEQ